MKRYTLQFATNNRAPFHCWLDLANEIFDGFTWFAVNGVWQSVDEISYKIEILSDKDIEWSVKYLGRYIKAKYSQDAVLYTVEEIIVEFL